MCDSAQDPINGHKNCTEDARAVQCTLACQQGFAFAFKPTNDYFCEVPSKPYSGIYSVMQSDGNYNL